MMERVIVACTACKSVSTARKRDDGSFLLPIGGEQCECGNDSFREFSKEDTAAG